VSGEDERQRVGYMGTESIALSRPNVGTSQNQVLTQSADSNLHWEKRLAAEGLAPLDCAGDKGISARRFPADDSSHVVMASAVERWQAWARSVLGDHLFTSPKHRAVWELYAAGKSYSQIQNAVGGSRRAISWAVAAVESAAPPKPCGNPWRQDHRGHGAAKDPRIVWYAARRRRRAALKQKVEPMPPNPITKFSRIILARNEELEITGRRPAVILQNVTGRFVNGGIEVLGQVDAFTKEVHAFPYVMWLPAARIRQADRMQEGT